MIKWLILFFLFFVVATLFGLKIVEDPGYTLIAYRTWSIEMPLWATLLAYAVSFMVLSLFFKSLGFITHIPQALKKHRFLRRQRLTLKRLASALLNETQGNYAKAQKYYIQANRLGFAPMTTWLKAAKMANKNQDFKKRDYSLQQARSEASKGDKTPKLIQAQILVDNKDWSNALFILESLSSNRASAPLFYELCYRCYLQLGEYTKIISRLPQLKKHKLLSHEAYTSLERQCYYNEWLAFLKQQPNETLTLQYFSKLPYALQYDTDFNYHLAEHLIKLKADIKAEKHLRSSLNKNWHESLICQYAKLEGNIHNYYKTCQKWLKKHPESAALYFAIGQFACKMEQPDDAIKALQTSLEKTASKETYLALASLIETHQGPQVAKAYYKEGLIFACQNPPS